MNSITTFTLTTLFILLIPLVISTTKIFNSYHFPSYVKMAVSYAFAISLIPALMFILTNQNTILSNWHWITFKTLKLCMSFNLDYFSLIFMPVALFVTWSIMEFSQWYMHTDPNINRFFKFLLLFLLTMLILVTANNLFQLFIGWEGVGIMSFLLIGWWWGRTDANTAALQAILYNRIGDLGLILTMAWFILNYNSWDLQQLAILKKTDIMPIIGLLIAAMGKSAQFGLHPWLPSAMEGPTPVSALLHSSTMVVAGVFLLVRFYPMMNINPTAQSLILCLGALTTLFAALCALTQNDLKKIIAFSTLSQLGLMMVTIGINQPHLAFIHICTHAFFKAMLFMCSGSIIHSLNGEQDIRKMGGLFFSSPLTASAMVIGSLALAGTPYLTGFYSKDLIIEAANSSNINAWALLLTIIATSMTTVYSFRTIYYALLTPSRHLPLITINENNNLLMNAIKRLMYGSIIAGFILTWNLPPTFTPIMTMPTYLKLTALVASLFGLLAALDLCLLTHNLKLYKPSSQYNFTVMLGYFQLIIHRFIPHMKLSMSQTLASSTMDMIWLEKTFPKFIAKTNLYLSTLSSTQKGQLKLYFLSHLITLITCIIIII
nr:NADH dehydrogenase subunit 5 [Potamogale velox]